MLEIFKPEEGAKRWNTVTTSGIIVDTQVRRLSASRITEEMRTQETVTQTRSITLW